MMIIDIFVYDTYSDHTYHVFIKCAYCTHVDCFFWGTKATYSEIHGLCAALMSSVNLRQPHSIQGAAMTGCYSLVVSDFFGMPDCGSLKVDPKIP